ncbi:MAG: hypothetical protein ACKVOL_10305 [Novosphingobium sp.]
MIRHKWILCTSAGNRLDRSGVAHQLELTISVRQHCAATAAAKLGAPAFLAGSALYQPDPAKMQANLQAGHTAGMAAIKAMRGDLPVGVSLAMLDDQIATGR